MSELVNALQKCRETVGPTLPCLEAAYLTARYEYHKLLVAAGMLDPKLAERKPFNSDALMRVSEWALEETKPLIRALSRRGAITSRLKRRVL